MGMRAVYRKIAKKYGVSVDEVKSEMQAAINEAYKNTPNDGITGAWQARVPRKDEIPTTEEFINYAIAEARKRNG